VPFAVDPQELYTAETLYSGLDLSRPETFSQCYDQQVYNHYLAQGKVTDNPLESLARNLHDFCIMQSTKRLLARYDKCQVVAVMGGNAMRRDDSAYEKVARISKALTEKGSLMVSGGGSGAMEATGFGAWMAGRSEEEFREALSRLASVPVQESHNYLAVSFGILRDYPQTQYINLSIPTWLYGHEWTSPFATHIAKLFENSVREDTLLTVAYGGIIYAPGRAGTIQEVFQEAVQNHYLTFGFASPMVFLDTEFWSKTTPFYPLLVDLLHKGIYKNLLLSLTDEVDEAVKTITDFQQMIGKQNV
jgi:predicted Rossmann-fold nucleotide-binding protein